MISGIIGVIIGSFITYILTDRIARKQQRYVATGKFHAEFVDAMIDLNEERADVCKILTTEVIARHKRAKVNFQHHVPSCKRKKFDEAWEQYENTFVRTASPGSLDNRATECKQALEKIESVLKFAEYS